MRAAPIPTTAAAALPPITIGATTARTSCTRRASKKAPWTRPPPSTISETTPSSPSQSSSAGRSTRPSAAAGNSTTLAPVAAMPARQSAGAAGVQQTTVRATSCSASTRALGGVRPRLSSARRSGCDMAAGAGSGRAVSWGSSSRIVSTPTRMASCRTRSRCDQARVRGPAHPARVAAGGGDLAIQRGGPLGDHEGPAGATVLGVGAVVLHRGAGAVAAAHDQAGLAQPGDATPVDAGIRVRVGDDHLPQAGGQDRLRAGWGAAVHRAWLQGDVEGRAAGVVAGLAQRCDFGVGAAGRGRRALADDPAVAHDHGAHGGVGAGGPQHAAREFQGPRHVARHAVGGAHHSSASSQMRLARSASGPAYLSPGAAP